VVSLRSNPPPQFLPLCDSFHPADTPGSRPEGGRWAGELVEDFHNANAQVDFHNEEFHEGVEAYVALRIGGAFIGPVMG
jgi:hypothetical protein